ncbi:hypothetical protein HAX54_017727 [Datura stramonium]|uniref:Uncharacterized protein n=1 Tax=Datura stramonium TaxID=4076 RepID=A0ABS8S0W0_DATST|nr:hypothetical protein [Datura stramonium]
MEATASFSSSMASLFFPLCKPPSQLPSLPTCNSSWTGSTHSLSFSSKTHSLDIWRVINSRNVVTPRRDMRGVIRAEMFGQLTSGLKTAWNKLKEKVDNDLTTAVNVSVRTEDSCFSRGFDQGKHRGTYEGTSGGLFRSLIRVCSVCGEEAVGTGLIRGVKPDQQLVKIVRDELVKLMGGEVSELVFAKSGPTIILLTSVYKVLARQLPAAIDQLVILGEQVDVPVYAQQEQIGETVLNPTEVLLVVDAMTGQEAAGHIYLQSASETCSESKISAVFVVATKQLSRESSCACS